ncbi:DUF47 domain-containing protein [Planctomycetota bacterium]
MLLPFARAKVLEASVSEFLDVIAKSSLELRSAMEHYLSGDRHEFQERIEKVVMLERLADEIRKRTETTLYTHSLIPESRGDVLGLLENMDNLVDRAKEVLQRMDVERPEIPRQYNEGFKGLMEFCALAVENVVSAARAYFCEVHLLKDYTNKVDHYESEADRAGLKLKKRIFGSDLDLSRKMHLRYFAEEIETISDLAEGVAERLVIASIKRSI